MLYRGVAVTIIVVCSILSAANGAINLVPNNTAAVVGDDVRLICQSANTASDGIDWQFGLVIIVSGCNSIDASYKTEISGNSCILIIPNVRLSQAGGYSCVYATWDGSTYGVQVIVAEDPPTISEMSGKDLTALDVSEIATIICSLPNFAEVNSFTVNIILSSDDSAILPQEISSSCSSSSCEVLVSVTSPIALSTELYCTVRYIATQGSDAWLEINSTIVFNSIPESTDAATSNYDVTAPAAATSNYDVTAPEAATSNYDVTAPEAGAIAAIVIGCIGGLALLCVVGYLQARLLYKEARIEHGEVNAR